MSDTVEPATDEAVEPSPRETTEPDKAATQEAPPAEASRRAGRRMDALVTLVYLLGAFWVTVRAWRDPWGSVLGDQTKDQAFNEWMLAHNAHVLRTLSNPFFTTLQNAPDGINLMGNVAMQGPGLLLAPLTIATGAEISYLVLVTANLFLSPLAWYWLLSRKLVHSRVAAFVGALFIGFAPAMISHSNGHPHMTAQWLIPFIIWRITLLGQRGITVRNGLILGALVLVQIFVGEEILFLTAVGCALWVIGYAIFRFRDAHARSGRALGSLAIAGGLVLLFAGYPLYVQFAGPQSYSGHPGGPKPATLLSFVANATESIGGGRESAAGLAPNFTEEAAFYGWPLVLIALAGVIWLRRETIVRVLAVIGLGAAALSLGPSIRISNWRDTGIPGPFRVLEHLPVVNAMVVARFNVVTTVVLGALLAVIVAKIVERPRGVQTTGLPIRLLAFAALAGALVPVMPTPLAGNPRPHVPEFVTEGHWRDYVAKGRTLVPVPVSGMTSIRWASAADVGFAVPDGYFLSEDDNTTRWGSPPRPTWQLLTKVAAGDVEVSEIGTQERSDVVTDLRFWKADAVVLATRNGTDVHLLLALEKLLGPGERVKDVWVWDVRPITA